MKTNETGEENAEFYNKQYVSILGDINNTYNNDITNWSPIWNWMSSCIVGNKVLDVGCGFGHLCKMLSEKGKKVTGIDFSRISIEQSQKRAPLAKFILVDIMKNLSLLKTIDYDTIIFSESLEHIKDDIAIIRHIPPAKECLISVPPYYSGGHVRWFESLQDVKDRYSPLIKIESAEIVTQFYCLRGIRIG